MRNEAIHYACLFLLTVLLLTCALAGFAAAYLAQSGGWVAATALLSVLLLCAVIHCGSEAMRLTRLHANHVDFLNQTMKHTDTRL